MFYYSSPDGGLHWRGQEDSVPPDWTRISKPSYDTAMARYEKTLVRRHAQIVEAEQAEAEQDYAALIAAGVPPRVAARIIGRGA